jgi:tRNA 2-thiouridine synthesizing protein B
MSLHTWNKAGATAPQLAACLAVLAQGDTLLLLEDGVYLTLNADFMAVFAALAAKGPRLCALAPDLAARGISARISPAVNVIGYKEFVALSLQHQQVVNWF